MANIKVDELHLTGYYLFQDFETFLNELTNQSLEFIAGGGSFITFFGFGGYGLYSTDSYNSSSGGYSGSYGYGHGYGYKHKYYC